MDREIIKKNGIFIVVYLVWVFIHFTLFLTSNQDSIYKGFWPFDHYSSINAYGVNELFVYGGLPVLLFLIYRLIKNDM